MVAEKVNPSLSCHTPTLYHMLRVQAERQPDQVAVTFLVDPDGKDEQGEVHLTYGELDRQARAIAALLQRTLPETQSFRGNSRQAAFDQRALLLFPPGLDFISAFFGCMYAGVVAVPTNSPRLNRSDPRIQAIAANAQASLVLTTNKILQSLKKRFDHLPDLAPLRWLGIDKIGTDLAGEWRDPAMNSNDLAFLQYTSGSTGNPKGVMISHANVLHNLEIIQNGLELNVYDNKAIYAFWLPSFHDMGLIGGILEPIYLGAPVLLMAPADFVKRPVRWLEMISRHRATISGGPNFAYKMCVDKITLEQRAGLDLSSWKVAFCGAEPIREETLQAFADTFAPYGFRRQAYYPCYGLAESTLMVTGGDGPAAPLVTTFNIAALARLQARVTEAGDDDGVALVSCGSPRPGQRVAIADPDTLATCADGVIGEIWVAGPSVSQGYWQRPNLSNKVFRAHLSDSGDGPFLRTGDLGFLSDGQLYITGRLKDLIIIRGLNHSPPDIEFTVSKSHDALAGGMSAAFSVVVDSEEKLVVVHEMARRHRNTAIETILPAVRGALTREHQLQLFALVLIRPLSMPRTSSGKIKRHVCKEMFLEGTLKVVDEWRAEIGERGKVAEWQGNKSDAGFARLASYQPSAESQDISLDDPSEMKPTIDVSDLLSELTQASTRERRDIWQTFIQEQIMHVLGLSQAQIPDVNQDIATLGIDSVVALELSHRFQSAVGQSLPTTLVFEYKTIAELADYLADGLSVIETTIAAENEIEQETADQILVQLDRLSDEQVNALLNKLSLEDDIST